MLKAKVLKKGLVLEDVEELAKKKGYLTVFNSIKDLVDTEKETDLDTDILLEYILNNSEHYELDLKEYFRGAILFLILLENLRVIKLVEVRK